MAAGITGAGNLLDGLDYSKSHRPVPVPGSPSSPTAVPSYSRPHYGQQQYSPQQQYHYQHQHQQQSPQPRDHNLPRASSDYDATGVTAGTEHRRRGSFSFKRPGHTKTVAPASPPPLPLPTAPAATFTTAALGHGHARAPAPPPNYPTEEQQRQARQYEQYEQQPQQSQVSSYEQQHTFLTSIDDRSDRSRGEANMLRKSSRVRQQQAQAEQQAQAAASTIPRQPPHLPSFNPLPNIDSFGGEDARQDSGAVFDDDYNPSNPSTPANNFSRSAYSAMSSSNNSSSPAYAIRSGNAFAQQAAASSSPAGVRSPNGDYATDSVDRSESMAHRGRYSYGSNNNTTPHVNSPRRVRRRKDPTPFK